jgi:hypothetical protein
LQSKILFTVENFYAPNFSRVSESDRTTWRREKGIQVNLMQKRFLGKYLGELGSYPMPWLVLRDLQIFLAALGEATRWRMKLGKYLEQFNDDDNIFHQQHRHQAWEQTAQVVQPNLPLQLQFHLLQSHYKSKIQNTLEDTSVTIDQQLNQIVGKEERIQKRRK